MPLRSLPLSALLSPAQATSAVVKRLKRFAAQDETLLPVESKHGVLGLTKTAALEYAAQGIRVNAVCPAVIETPMAERAFADPEVSKRMRSLHPLGRFGKPTEVAEAVLWLCSDRSSFTTGQYLGVDGGLLIGPMPNA